MSEIKVSGLSDLQRFLDQLPAKIEANILRSALRAAAKPIADEAKQNVPVGEPTDTAKRRYRVYSGALRDSIRISARTDRRNGNVTASVKAGGKVRKTGADVFYANFLEFGTRAHGGESENPGISPRPFMRPAIDSQSEAAVVAAGEYIKKRLATKNGFNTADIEIGIEEQE